MNCFQQEVLNTYGAIIWIEPPNVFVSNKIEKYLVKSKKNGILTWPRSEPVSQLTHPSMFSYFSTKPSEFHFVHMLDTTQFILYNNQKVHKNLMLTWVKCALSEECIAPRGSKFSGCDYTRRPTFLYSGCHKYEMSAFSIITNMLYNFDLSKMTMRVEMNSLNRSNQTQLMSNVSVSSWDQFEDSFMTVLTEKPQEN